MSSKKIAKPDTRGDHGRGHPAEEKHGRESPTEAKPRITEVPGRPEADREPRREKAYGPGGAAPETAGRPSRPPETIPIDEPTSNIDDPAIPGEPPGAGRTAEGADTKPL